MFNSLDCISSTTTTHPMFQTVTGLVGYFRHDHQGSCNKHRGTDGVRDRTHIDQHCRVSTTLDKYLTAAGRVLARCFYLYLFNKYYDRRGLDCSSLLTLCVLVFFRIRGQVVQVVWRRDTHRNRLTRLLRNSSLCVEKHMIALGFI